MTGYTYILRCNDNSYYTGSTKDLARRLSQHQSGNGANHTKKRLPVVLVYYEKYDRIDTAFYREKQIQGWSRKKKEALINNMPERLHELARCMNGTSHVGFGSAQPTMDGSAESTRNGSAQPTKDGSAESTENDSMQSTENDSVKSTGNGSAQSTKHGSTKSTENASTQPKENNPTENNPKKTKEN